MKEWFRDQLGTLHLHGIQQARWLADKDEVEDLLNRLTVISEKNYGYIPVEVQKEEIEKQLIRDPDGKDGLTTRNVHKWLSAISSRFWSKRNADDKEQMTKESKPVTGERREHWLNIWKLTLAQTENNFPSSRGGGGSRLKQSLGVEKAESLGVIKNYEVGETCPDCNGDGGGLIVGDPLCEKCKGHGEINIVTIPATSESEARRQYVETFGPLKQQEK